MPRLVRGDLPLSRLSDEIKSYQAYHQDPRNRLFHFLGVPTVTFSILIPMGLIRLSTLHSQFTVASLFVLGTLLYYFSLDRMIAALVSVFILPLLVAANYVASPSFSNTGWVFGVSFVLGWIFQLIGHYFEGRRPALLDNFGQIFSAPLFLMAELLFGLGFRSDLRDQLSPPPNDL